MPTRGSKDPNGRALRGRRAHTTFALLTDPARQIWNSFNNRANAGGANAPEAAVNGCLYDRFKSLYNKTATKPSLVIVPARFKSGTLYSQIPSSNADFTVTRPLNTATRFDSSALIQTGITSGVPRLDYYTSGGVTGCPALLVEPAATNLHTQSEAFASNYTQVINLSASGTNLTAPDNSATADRYFETTANGVHIITIPAGGGFALTSGTVYTFSTFAQSVGGRNFRLALTAGGSIDVLYTLSGSGTVSNTSVATIQNFGNGWYRCTYTFTATSSVNFRQNIYSVSGTTNSFVGDVTKGFIVWGAQLETGSVATSYIPTTAGTGSRSADVVSVSGAVSGSIGQTEGVVYAQVDLRNWTASGRVLAISNGTSDARVMIQVGANRTLQAVVTAASGEVANIATASGQVNGIYKCAVAYASGDFAFYVNGNQIGTDSSGAVPACNNVALGKIETSASTNFLNDRILAGALYNTRLLNADLATLTTP